MNHSIPILFPLFNNPEHSFRRKQGAGWRHNEINGSSKPSRVVEQNEAHSLHLPLHHSLLTLADSTADQTSLVFWSSQSQPQWSDLR